MTILDTIVKNKRYEVQRRKQKFLRSDLEKFPSFSRTTKLLQVAEGPGIIAEFKRKSPSKGSINQDADPAGVALGYAEAGVSAMSVLTDRDFFGGSFKHLQAVREVVPELPLLRKDFMVEPYQIYEAKAYGADMILLIAAVLDKVQIRDMAQKAAGLGLQVLLEVHNREELDCWDPAIKFIGVNNRNLKDFSVDTRLSLDLLPHFPEEVTPVSESGLSDPAEVKSLHEAGYRLFLMGENFMKEENPGLACSSFIEKLK